MDIEYLSNIRNFIKNLTNSLKSGMIFNPLTLSPVEIASVIEKLQGIYDSPPRERYHVNTVLIGSTIKLIDMLDYSEMTITVVLPDDSDPSQGMISILSPLGSTLLGAKIGETVNLFVGNRMSRLRILAVA